MTSLIKASILSGLLIFSISVAGMIFQEAIMVMLFSLLIPGLLFGFIISFYEQQTTLTRRILFFLLCSATYYLTLFIIDAKGFDYKMSPLKILLGSALGALLLQFWYDMVFQNSFTFKWTIVIPMAIGFIAAIPTTISAFFFNNINPSDTIWNALLWAGLFSIFPLFQFFFSYNLSRREKRQQVT